MQIVGVMPTLEEARELFSDVFFVYKGYRPSKELLKNGHSTWYLRVRTEELLALLVQEFKDKEHK